MSTDSSPSTEGPGVLDRLRQRARELGFLGMGVAKAGPSPHASKFHEWIAAGKHGTMGYMARQVARRVDPRESLPGARSVVVVTLPYFSEDPVPSSHGEGQGKIARYARGRDYHKVMPPRLKKLAESIGDGGRWQTWYAVDTAPILERDWAEASGVGWIGKNGLIIDRAVGSWFFLGVVVTDRALPTDSPATDHCGECTACLDACPTGAITRARSVDARRCISYLTIEHRGAFEPELGEQLSGWVFGCDICQEVCPYNSRTRREVPAVDPDFEPRDLPRDLSTLSSIDREAFLAAFQGTPVMRTGWQGMQRNARAVQKE